MGNKRTKNNKVVLIIVILALIIMVAIIASLNSNPSLQNHTFSDGSVSFSYPAEMINTTDPGIGVSNDWKNVEYLIGPNVNIAIYTSNSFNDPKSAKEAVISDIKQHSNKVLSSSEEINLNGVLVSRMVDEFTDSNKTRVIRDYQLFFKGNGVIYGIDVLGLNSSNSEVNETADLLFRTIKIS